MYPATHASLPAEYPALPKPAKSLMLPPESVEKNRRAWVDEWLAAMSK